MAYRCPHCRREIADAVPRGRVAEIAAVRRESDARASALEERVRELEAQLATPNAAAPAAPEPR